ncbi:hypothetical protein [Oscillochloris sp. ZM17-4]|uniref:hypothetical protein n=1 Tax=Oscillochloris sp. ZM17-4 TaxID=2866714 RepID=UPI00210446DD|nr:hypothetical protein [Oscillochloris sp. ZM17-4]
MSDLPLSDELYPCLRDLLRDRLGLHFPASRRSDLARSLSLVAQDLGYSDLGRLYTALLAGGPVWDTAIRHLTIGETYFFRNSSQFAALRERILPDLLARRAGARSLRLEPRRSRPRPRGALRAVVVPRDARRGAQPLLQRRGGALAAAAGDPAQCDLPPAEPGLF